MVHTTRTAVRGVVVVAVVVFLVTFNGQASALWPLAPQPDQPTADPCEAAANVIFLSNPGLHQACWQPAWAGPRFGYDKCWLRGPQWLVDYNTGGDLWWNGSWVGFPDPLDPHANAEARVLVKHTGAARTVQFTAAWDEARGGGLAKGMVVDQVTRAVLFDQTVARDEGQCWGSHCDTVMETPPLGVVGGIAAGLVIERQKGPEGIAKARDQWAYTVCQGPACQVCAAPFSWWNLGVLVAPLLLKVRRRTLFGLGLLLLPFTVQAKGLPVVSVWETQGGEGGAQGQVPVLETDAVPGMQVAQGTSVADGEGNTGCRLPEIRITTNAETYLDTTLLVDEQCAVIVGEVAPGAGAEPPAEAEGSAAGNAPFHCIRNVMNRTTVGLRLFSFIPPVFFDYNRLSRVWQTFTIDDTGQQAPLNCFGFDAYASSLEFLGWHTQVGNLGIPDYMVDYDGTDSQGTNAISYPMVDPVSLGQITHGACVQVKASAFNFIGSPWIEGLTTFGFSHGLLAGCGQSANGYYECVHAVSEGSVLPNQHILIWPSGSFNIFRIDLPLYTQIYTEGAVEWWDCPNEIIFPPQVGL